LIACLASGWFFAGESVRTLVVEVIAKQVAAVKSDPKIDRCQGPSR
jgi:hypothetical protein